MELSTRPLFDNAADRRLYVPRAEAGRVLENALHGINTLVVGERGSGKTTLLRQTAWDLREADHPSVYVDAALADSASTFLQMVRVEAGRAPTMVDALRDASRAPTAPVTGLGETGALLDLVRSMRAPAGESSKAVVFVDSLPSSEVAHTVFGRLRDELWQLPFTWVVAASPHERGDYLTPPADTFFENVVELAPLTAEQQRALVRARLGERADALPSVEGIRHGNPRELLGILRQAAEGKVGPADLMAARAEREARVSRLGRSASMLVAELEASGPASASDPELLKRLGWTRQRAAQVFAQLEDAGVVHSYEQRGDAGRARKVYDLRDPVVP